MRYFRSVVWVGVGCLGLTAALGADTLVLRDGRRVRGDLIAVRDGVIEFEGQDGFRGRRERLRIDRADVARIELDDATSDRGDRGDRADRTGDRPSGLRERDVNVEAAVAWKDTAIDVRPGQTLYFSASGRVRWGSKRQDGPAGEDRSPYNAQRPIAGRPAAALIGRIGESGDYFFIGDDKGPVRMRAGGRLYLGINDDYLSDNSGAFRVTVYY